MVTTKILNGRPNNKIIIPDGPVKTAVIDPDTNIMYIGGQFGSIGQPTGNFNLVSDDAATLVTPFPKIVLETFTGIRSAVTDGQGGWIIYTNNFFDENSGMTGSGLINVKSDGTLNPNFNIRVTGIPIIHRVNSTLYVAGFTSIQGMVGRLVSIDLSDLDSPVSPESRILDSRLLNINFTGGSIFDFAVFNNKLIVGGTFTRVDGLLRNRIVEIDLLAAQVTGTDYGLVGTSVRGITATSNGYYFCGSFSAISALPRAGGSEGARGGLAFVDSDGILGEFFAGSFISDDPADHILVTGPSNDQIFVCGFFDSISGVVSSGDTVTRRNFAAFDTSGAGTLLPTDLQIAEPPSGEATNILALAETSSGYYCAGKFAGVLGEQRFSLAKFGLGPSNEAILSSWNPRFSVKMEGGLRSIQSVVSNQDGSAVLVGGEIVSYNTQYRANVAAINLTTYELMDWNPEIGSVETNEGVNSLALISTTNPKRIVIGGTFTSVGNESIEYLTCVDTDGDVTTSFPTLDGPVNSVDILDSKIYVAGAFFTVGDGDRLNIAAFHFDGILDESWGVGLFDDSFTTFWDVSMLKVINNRIYLMGRWSQISGLDCNDLAAVGTDNVVDPFFAPKPGLDGTYEFNTLRSLNSNGDGSVIYVTGDFDEIGGSSRTSLAAISSSTGSALPFNPVIDPTSDEAVSAVGVLETETEESVFLLGAFETVNGEPRRGFAKVDAATGQTTDSWDPQPLEEFVFFSSSAEYGTIFLDQENRPMFGCDIFGVSLKATGFLLRFDYSKTVNLVGNRQSSGNYQTIGTSDVGVDTSGTKVLGATGILGVTGLSVAGLSPRGRTGLVGSQGATGIDGVIGLLGPTGLIGITGIQGGTGVAGHTGVVGTAGYRSLNDDANIEVNDYLIGLDSSQNSLTVTLPLAASAGPGKIFVMQDEGGQAFSNPITINLSGDETLNGNSSYQINRNYQNVWIYSNGVDKYFLQTSFSGVSGTTGLSS